MGCRIITLCSQEIIPSILVVDMRSFRGKAAGSVPYDVPFANFSCVEVDFRLFNVRSLTAMVSPHHFKVQIVKAVHTQLAMRGRR